MTERLPALMDCRAIMDEAGVKRGTAEAFMRCCAVKVRVGRKVFVYRAEVEPVIRTHEVRDRPAKVRERAA